MLDLKRVSAQNLLKGRQAQIRWMVTGFKLTSISPLVKCKIEPNLLHCEEHLLQPGKLTLGDLISMAATTWRPASLAGI